MIITIACSFTALVLVGLFLVFYRHYAIRASRAQTGVAKSPISTRTIKLFTLEYSPTLLPRFSSLGFSSLGFSSLGFSSLFAAYYHYRISFVAATAILSLNMEICTCPFFSSVYSRTWLKIIVRRSDW
jgi:hypothetical protein